MTTLHDFEATALAPVLAPGVDDFDRTAFAPRGDEATAAYAWASSPLGEPADEAGDLPSGDCAPLAPSTPASKRKPVDKLIVAAGLMGAIGAGAALWMALSGGSPQPQPTAAVLNSTEAPAAAPAATAAAAVQAPAASAPDNVPAAAPVLSAPAPAPVVSAQDNRPAPVAVIASPPEYPPAADPGTPPAAAPSGPVVIVNAPPPPSVWVPVQPPQLPPLPSPPKLPAPPKLPPPPAPPPLCLPPHHLVQGVCK